MKLLRRIPALFRQEKLDAEMSEEMRAHLELQTEENIARGMSAEEARYAALRAFGGVEQIKERVREQRSWIWVEHLGRDVRHAARMLRKTPVLSVVIVLSLGIGIGANTVIYSWLRGLIFRPLPGVENAARLFLVEPRNESGSYPGTSWPEYRDLRERMTSVEGLAAYRTVPLNLGEPGREERIYSQFVSGNYFSTLGMRPFLGRFLRADEAVQPGAAPVVVVSHAFWRSHFASAPDAVGQTLRLNERTLTVVGVAPEGFHGTIVGLGFDLWVPATMAPILVPGSEELVRRDSRGYSMIGTLRTGASVSRARTELDAAMRALAEVHPATNATMKAEVLAFWRAPRGAPRFFFGALAILQGFMLLVLLVVCANAANLLLARATTRQREIGVRLALGARPPQIVQLLLAESLMLGLAASALGTCLAVWGTNALRAVPMPGGFPIRLETDLDASGLGLAVALGLGCALVFGLAPALHSARTDSHLALRAAPQGILRNGLRRLLVSIEVALALLVLFITALFLRSFLETRSSDPGFEPDGVLLAGLDLSASGYRWEDAPALMDELLRRVRMLPGVEAAAIASWVPLDFHAMPSGTLKLEGRVRTDGGTDRALSYVVTPDYFRTMGIPLLNGGDFAALGDPRTRRQAIVNEEFVRRFAGGAAVLGRKVEGRTTAEIVGVVRNSLYETFGEPAKPIMYFSYRDRPGFSGQLHVRARGAGAQTALAPALRRMVREWNPAISLYDVRTMTEHVEKNLFFRRIPARMFAVLGPLILLLAAVGIYAVVAHTVAQRTREIGVRLALGAAPGRVVREMVGESMGRVMLGIVPAWLAAAMVLSHARGLGGPSAPILLGVPALLLGVALLASWWPARRAAKVDPMVALRAE